MNLLRAIRLILTLRCEHASRLVSDQYDRDLSFSERWALRLHGWICKSCWRFRDQMKFIHEAAKQLSGDSSELVINSQLSTEARERILNAVREENRE
ncbi:MAG: zf-HC2 domain-containing protein [Planctomycetota bacterium]